MNEITADLQNLELNSQNGSISGNISNPHSHKSGNGMMDQGNNNNTSSNSVFANIKQQHERQQAQAAAAATGNGSSSTPLTHKITILVDVSFDRLLLLCDVPQSVFLKSNVFPFLRYYLIPGEEETCIYELGESFNKLQNFSHMSICVMILFESEGGLLLPDLKLVMKLLLDRKNLVRFILFNQQRNVTTVVTRATDRHVLVSNLLAQISNNNNNTNINNNNNGNNNQQYHLMDEMLQQQQLLQQQQTTTKSF
eukprot:UN01556